jgi:integrase
MRSNNLDIEQIQKLRDALRGHELSALITLALVTGLRRDELLSLKWQNVDLDKHELTVQNAKTKNNARTIPLSLDVTEILKEHRLRQREAEVAAGLTWANLDLVFSGSCGERLCPHQLMKEFHEMTDLAGLPRISFHDLRVTVGQTLHKQQERRA